MILKVSSSLYNSMILWSINGTLQVSTPSLQICSCCWWQALQNHLHTHYPRAHSRGFALRFMLAQTVLSLNVKLCLKRRYLAQVLLKQSSAVPQPHNFCLVQGTDVQVGVMRWDTERELHALNQRPAVRSIAPVWSACTTFSSALH